MELILVAVYVYFGIRANDYLKYHLFNIRAEFYSSIMDHLAGKVVYAMFLGWATIPLAILHNLLFSKD
mgnify:CR=1 FL=1